MGVHDNASKPKSWPLQSSRKNSTTADEEDIMLSQDMQDIFLACKMDTDNASANKEEEEDGGGHCNELLDKL